MNQQGPRRTFHSIPLRTKRPAAPATTSQPVLQQRPPNPAMTSASIQARIARQHDKEHIASRQTQRWADTGSADVEEEDEEEMTSPAQMMRSQVPRSAIRYTDTHGRSVLQSGNRRYVFAPGPQPPPKRRPRLFSVGLGMLVMLVFFVGGSWLLSSCQASQANATYGFPRTWQTDQNVGHGKGASHFLFENLDGHVFFEEIPQGSDFKHAVLYSVTVLFGPDAAQVAVTATFADVNHDDRLDILIHLGNQTIVYLNTGTGFKPEQ